MSTYHVPALLHETLDYLNVKEGNTYIDATLGGGTVALEIVKRGGRVLGIDRDEESIEEATRLNKEGMNVVQGNFKDIKTIAAAYEFNNIFGIVFDLGVSSHQLDTPDRGFSFQAEGPLDMRMDLGISVKASDLINGLREDELAELFTRFGDEPRAKQLAKKIVQQRKTKPITTTMQLAKIIEQTIGRGKIHPATRVFQALRIVVNDEMENLRVGLGDAIDILVPQGRLVVLSYHSLEDRIVKNMFIQAESKGLGSILTKKPVMAQESEVQLNRRARSAKLRAFEKI